MSPAVFRAGLSYSQELDRRFGRVTTAAKMTDVPGHTRGIVPLLAEAGVRFLHLGVNTASPVPDVPDVFRWRAPAGEEVVVMYQNSYGATHFPHGFDDGLSFAHTSDNIGPQSVPQTVEATRHLQAENPGTVIVPSTLDAFGDLLWSRREEFPIVDMEIGDSWIHGVASDPHKTSRFLALQRLYDAFAEELTPPRLAFGRGLAMVAEHTWGVDIKSYLRDETAWDRADFDRMRAADPRFVYTEQSWAEQRAYLDDAVAHLDPADDALADGVVLPAAPAIGGSRELGGAIDVAGWSIDVDRQTGDVASITSPDGRTIAGRGGSLLGFRHESYDHDDMVAQLDSYILHRADWAILDHDKPGLAGARTARSARWTPRYEGVVATAGSITVRASLPGEATAFLGAPVRIEITIKVAGARNAEIIVTLRDKPANRMPEAGFVTFTPTGDGGWEYLKLGLWQPAARVARKGGAQLQAVAAVRTKGLALEPLDTPLVAPAEVPFMRFHPDPPSLAGGIRFNLYNNKWGTNFPMWWEGTFTARYLLSLD
jgi:hypothetical protein